MKQPTNLPLLVLAMLLALVNWQSAHAQYCTPTWYGGGGPPCADGLYLGNVTIGTINNTTGTTCGMGGYSDFTGLSTNVFAGSTPAISFTNPSSSGNDIRVAVFVDFNNDMAFVTGDGEKLLDIFQINAGMTGMTTIMIPAMIAPGSYRMRIVMDYAYTGATQLNPCNLWYGEVEDYTLTVVPPCPEIGAVTASPELCELNAFDLEATGLMRMSMAENMETNFGIQFVAYPDNVMIAPYIGGTSLGVVPFASLTMGGTVATLQNVDPSLLGPPGMYTILAILSPTPADMNCRPYASTTVELQASSLLNCRDLNLSVGADGTARFVVSELIQGSNCSPLLNVMITTPGGVLVYRANGLARMDEVVIADACRYLGQPLNVMVSYPSGESCQSRLTLKENFGPLFAPGRTFNLWCFDEKVGDISKYLNAYGYPEAYAPCFGAVVPSLVGDWVQPYDCEPGQDTTKIIYREFEAFDKLGRRANVFDTIILYRIPQLTPSSLFCGVSDTIYCSDTSDFQSPIILVGNNVLGAVALELVELAIENGELVFKPRYFDPKCGIQVHVDSWQFGNNSCEGQYKVRVELKQTCAGGMSNVVLDPPATNVVGGPPVPPNVWVPLTPDYSYWVCEFWITDLDTLPPVAICKGEPFFKGPLELDNWTFNTLRDFDFLHEEDFLGGLVQGLPPFEDVVLPDELTMLDTSKAPYSMCFASEQIIENPDIYLGLNTAFIVAEQDMDFTFDWDFLLGEFDEDDVLFGIPGAIGLIGYGINGTFYKLVEGIEEPLLDQWAEYQEFLDQVMAELEIDEELCNLNISLLLEDAWGGTTIRLKKGDVFTLFGIWVSNSDAKIQFSGENLIATNTHECAAHAYVPPLIVKEDWSGIKQVKATIESIGTVILQYDASLGCYVSHEQLKLPHREEPYKITYEVYDSCHNIGYEYCYLKVKDKTRPVAVADKGVTVSLSDKKVWVDAATFDEGSWDNCGVNFILARRSDWQEACVDLCNNVREEANCSPAGPEDYESAVIPIWTDGHDTLWCLDLEDDKHCDPVEAHYVKQMEWLCQDELPCGELIYNGWNYDLLRYATIECRDNHYLDNTAFRLLVEKALKNPNADPNDHLDGLIEEKFKCVLPKANAECILPFTFGRFPLLEFLLSGPMLPPLLPIPTMMASGRIEMMYLPEEQAFCGYNDAELKYQLDNWSQIGGGWSDAVPFSCDDACSPVTVEILVMDYWCNWSTAWTKVWVEDKTPVKVVKDVSEQEAITCKVYKENNYSYPGEDHPVSLEYIVEQAKLGTPEALDALDGIFGGYQKAWVDPYGHYVDSDGEEIEGYVPFYDSICDCKKEWKQVRVYDEHLGYLWVDSLVTECYYEADTLEFWNGIVAVNCAENVYCEQEVWCEFDQWAPRKRWTPWTASLAVIRKPGWIRTAITWIRTVRRSKGMFRFTTASVTVRRNGNRFGCTTNTWVICG
jgi:hypothetical protein